jgi:hypothetical protein
MTTMPRHQGTIFSLVKLLAMRRSIFSDVRNLNNRKHVQDCYDQVRRVLLEYCVNCYPNIPVSPRDSHGVKISAEIMAIFDSILSYLGKTDGICTYI